jgi:hypothetical protein
VNLRQFETKPAACFDGQTFTERQTLMPQPAFDQPHFDGKLYGDPEFEDGSFAVSSLKGRAFKSKATRFAIIGIFFCGVVFGPLAITNANKAEALGARAPFGKVCGWIATVIGVIGSLFVSLFILGILQVLTGSYSN